MNAHLHSYVPQVELHNFFLAQTVEKGLCFLSVFDFFGVNCAILITIMTTVFSLIN